MYMSDLRRFRPCQSRGVPSRLKICTGPISLTICIILQTWPQLRSLWMNVTWIMQRHLISELSHGHWPIRLCCIICVTRHAISWWKTILTETSDVLMYY